MGKYKVIPDTELERHINHPNFRRLEEKKDQFVVFMNSIKMKSKDNEIYFNIDKSARVAQKTYSIVIKKQFNKTPSRI